MPRTNPRYTGAYSVVPTIFTSRGNLDLDGQRRCIDFIIDAGADGLCILANYSEQFSLTDQERSISIDAILTHVNGRVPVIVTTTHYSAKICAERCLEAQSKGAAMVMIMPPYHGATIRVGKPQLFDFFKFVSDAIDIPIMYQDAPMSGTQVSARTLAELAQEVPNVCYFKIEVPNSANKLRELIRIGGDSIEGPWDGEEAITLFADLEAGARGGILGGGYPDGLRPIIDAYAHGHRQDAKERYNRWLPLINFENKQAGILAAKALFKAGGIIECDIPRYPLESINEKTRNQLIEIAKDLDAMVLRWA